MSNTHTSDECQRSLLPNRTPGVGTLPANPNRWEGTGSRKRPAAILRLETLSRGGCEEEACYDDSTVGLTLIEREDDLE